MKNNFDLTCYNMLKHVKYTIFHDNLAILEEFTYKKNKNSNSKTKIIIIIHISYKNYKFPFIVTILSLPMMVNSSKKVKFSHKMCF